MQDINTCALRVWSLKKKNLSGNLLILVRSLRYGLLIKGWLSMIFFFYLSAKFIFSSWQIPRDALTPFTIHFLSYIIFNLFLKFFVSTVLFAFFLLMRYKSSCIIMLRWGTSHDKFILLLSNIFSFFLQKIKYKNESKCLINQNKM